MISEMLGSTKQHNSRAQDDSNLFFQVEEVKFDDLYDWSTSTEAAKSQSSNKNKRKTGTKVCVNKRMIALFRFGNDVYGIDERCPHAGGPLHMGDIEAIGEAKILCVSCPWHKWKISLVNGKVRVPDRPRFTGVYPVEVTQDGCLKIGFFNFSSEYFNGDEDF